MRIIKVTRDWFRVSGIEGYERKKTESGYSWEKAGLPADYRYIAIHKGPNRLRMLFRAPNVEADGDFMKSVSCYKDGKTYEAGYSMEDMGRGKARIGCWKIRKKETYAIYEISD